MVVADLLRQEARTGHFFITQHTGCVGCHLARFCTLEDVARHYQLDVPAFMGALTAYVQDLPSNPKE